MPYSPQCFFKGYLGSVKLWSDIYWSGGPNFGALTCFDIRSGGLANY